MDAAAESPQIKIETDGNTLEEEKGDSEDEEEMLDWSKIGSKLSKGQRSLPKRGEKAFEPIAVGPSAYQKFTLDRARQAMSDALSSPREIQTKRLSQALWMPHYSHAKVVDARGTVFDTVGFTIRRQSDTQKRLELLPEEVLYMVERGSLLCWKESSNIPPSQENYVESDPVKLIGVPMSAQQCFAEMLGVEGITLEHYQVYSYLKRFGYTVRRAKPLQGQGGYIVYQHPPHKISFMSSIKNKLIKLWQYTTRFLRVNWWTRFHPGLTQYFHRTTHYPSMFKSLRVIPPFTPSRAGSLEHTSSYNVFFHVWKPESPWNRANPPPPDFEIVVVNARTTPVPSIDDLTALFSTLPFVPYQSKQQARSSKSQAASVGILNRYLAWMRGLLSTSPNGKGNPFGHLKAGKRSVIFAVVDVGTTAMYRFNEGCFNEWPMV